MARMTLIATTCALMALAGFTAIAGAQNSNPTELTRMTFTTTVELPGVTLPPGTYEFQLADSPQRNVVQVFRESDRQIMGQWTFVQAKRPRESDETVVMFRESEAGATPAIQYWYYPGETIGKEFIYPEKQAQQIAARTGQTVQSDAGPITPPADARADARTSPASAPDRDTDARPVEQAEQAARRSGEAVAGAARESGEAVADATRDGGRAVAGATREAAQETREAARETGEAVRGGAERAGELARADQPRPLGTSGEQAGRPVRSDAADPDAQDADPSRARASDELPRTASLAPLSGVLGLLALAAAAGLRRYYR